LEEDPGHARFAVKLSISSLRFTSLWREKAVLCFLSFGNRVFVGLPSASVGHHASALANGLERPAPRPSMERAEAALTGVLTPVFM
jgi:hypothetical protein